MQAQGIGLVDEGLHQNGVLSREFKRKGIVYGWKSGRGQRCLDRTFDPGEATVAAIEEDDEIGFGTGNHADTDGVEVGVKRDPFEFPAAGCPVHIGPGVGRQVPGAPLEVAAVVNIHNLRTRPDDGQPRLGLDRTQPPTQKKEKYILHAQRKDGILNIPGHGKTGNGKKDKGFGGWFSGGGITIEMLVTILFRYRNRVVCLHLSCKHVIH